MVDEIKEKIRLVPDFPKQGVLFRDITTLLKDPNGLRDVMKYFKIRYKGRKIDKVVGIESRGFILGATLAYMLGVGFVPVRKANKLPAHTRRIDYALEYGTDSLEIHTDSILPGERVLLIDDLLATGGTAKATTQLIESLGGIVTECAFLIEISNLKGREKLPDYNIFSLVEYTD
ncbi:adenine phosphoribosyltransferase [Candidatus Woesearchaeota archaeon]|nr:adenine phosphoribosyltransferase [Candidatus Woesearchaeota archaeon]